MPEAVNVEELRQRLYEECGSSAACRRAADYYLMLVRNPCYPPADKMTHKMRGFYMEFMKRHGRPPRCDVKALVEERLRGTALEKYAQEVAELAELVRRRLRTTSRVAAAVATIIVAEWHGVRVTRGAVAAHFGVSTATVRAYIKHAFELYIEHIVPKILKRRT